MRKLARARQLPAHANGVLPWQQDFWLLLVEHVLAKRTGAPDLLRLERFGAPAITQYTATTPELLRSFRKYNAGKPYHRQVRPFGFMVMLQRSNDAEQSTVMRIIAPFNRDPVRAAQKAFYRDSGATVSPGQLMSYAQSLRHYHNHPEAKFLNGERGDRGPTLRRHVISRSVVHIGKEANKLEPQQVTGIDPHAQVEFLVAGDRAGRLKAIAAAVQQFSPSAVAREAGLSRKHVSAIAKGTVRASEAALSKIERAASALDVEGKRNSVEICRALGFLRAECERVGLRQIAGAMGIDPSILSRVVSEQRGLSNKLTKQILSFPWASR